MNQVITESYEIIPSDIGFTQATPYYFSFQDSWKVKESKKSFKAVGSMARSLKGL